MTKMTMTPEQIQMMIDLMPTAQSLRDIAAIIGVKQQTLRYVATPFVALLRMQGALPPCECGKERFHPYGCSAVAAKSVFASGVFGQSPERAAAHREKREAVVEAIMTGATYSEIERRLGMKPKTARAFARYLTPEQRARRKKMEQGRALKFEETPRPFSDPLYARIAAAVPRWLSPSLRDDVISEMYVAVFAGVLAVDDVVANASRFSNAAISQFESRYGPCSIDEKLFDDGKTTLADRLADAAALAAFDALDDVQVGRSRQPKQEICL